MNTIRAADGWRLEYDLDAVPGDICVYNASGRAQVSASGEITQAHVDRWLAWFRRDHDTPQQLSLHDWTRE